MSRQIKKIIDRAALRENLYLIKNKLKGKFIWAVVKANAYGHGLKEIIDCLNIADGLACISPDEALNIRDLGWKKEILLLEGFFDQMDLLKIIQSDSIPVICTEEQVKILINSELKSRIPVYIKLNTGLNRLGFNPEEAYIVYLKLKENNINVIGISTHFANAEINYPSESVASVKRQEKEFFSVNIPVKRKCLSNSGAALFYPNVNSNEVRIGIALYGCSPDLTISSSEIGLKATQYFTTEIIKLNKVRKGSGISYGSKYICQQDTLVAVLACGYADGYPRNISSKGYVLIKGHRAPIIGRICMDLMMVDVSHIPNVCVGDLVELWGKNLLIEEVSDFASTIPHVLMCFESSRVPTLYLD